MFAFNQETLIKVFEGQAGIDLVSYGKPRDAFELPVDIPLWTSGYGGKYEMKHINVPKGVMVAVGNLEDVDLSDQAKLKAQLKDIDIYPTGHSGDFTGTDLKVLRKWFTDRSRLDNEVNNQTPISHAKKLTPAGLGRERFDDLVEYLADNMNLFKDPGAGSVLVPSDRKQRVNIVTGILNGLSKTVRYTRLDEPAKAFQLTEHIDVEKNNSAISLSLKEPTKILVERRYKNGATDITPLDRAMLGRTYVTADGLPLGDRAEFDVSAIALNADQIEHAGQPTAPFPYLRMSGFDAANNG